MKKRIGLLTLCIIMVAALFAGCGAKEVKATISNDSGWAFNEIYVAPTASDEWGEDQLGGTNILKSGGSYDIALGKADNGLYDIEAVDEDGTYWTFMRVPLEAGSEVIISYRDGYGIALSVSPKGDETEIIGTLEDLAEEEAYEEEQAVPDEQDGAPEEQEADWVEFEFTNYSNYIFDQVFVAAIDGDGPGYNHIESIGWLEPGESCIIGVDLVPEYGVALVDEDNDLWVFEYVILEDVYAADVSWPEDEDDPLLTVYYGSDGSSGEYWGQITYDVGDQLVG